MLFLPGQKFFRKRWIKCFVHRKTEQKNWGRQEYDFYEICFEKLERKKSIPSLVAVYSNIMLRESPENFFPEREEF